MFVVADSKYISCGGGRGLGRVGERGWEKGEKEREEGEKGREEGDERREEGGERKGGGREREGREGTIIANVSRT